MGAVAEALACGADAAQIWGSNPRTWTHPSVPRKWLGSSEAGGERRGWDHYRRSQAAGRVGPRLGRDVLFDSASESRGRTEIPHGSDSESFDS
jgi:hypothetical protein